MAAAETTVQGGMPARVFRISFSGELAYEVARSRPLRRIAFAARLMQLGRRLGVTPYGTEALAVMRIEKGHVAGNEIDGRTTARDLGLGRMLSTKKDCIGRVMAGRPALLDPDRPAFVGFKPVDPVRAPARRRPSHPAPCRSHGRQRPGRHHLRRLLADARPLDRPRPDRPRTAAASARSCAPSIPCATATSRSRSPHPCFIDPEGVRQRG